MDWLPFNTPHCCQGRFDRFPHKLVPYLASTAVLILVDWGSCLKISLGVWGKVFLSWPRALDRKQQVEDVAQFFGSGFWNNPLVTCFENLDTRICLMFSLDQVFEGNVTISKDKLYRRRLWYSIEYRCVYIYIGFTETVQWLLTVLV